MILSGLTATELGTLATITLNRPTKYNTLRFEMLERLSEVLRDANRDDDIRVIVLQGAGDSFCGGFEGRAFVRSAMERGVKAAVTERDSPFGDYSQGAPEDQPRKRSERGLPSL